MKRLAFLAPLALWGCLSGSNDTDTPAAPVAPGKYRAPVSVKWFEDDPAPRKFVDEQNLLADGTGEGRMYLVRTRDTVLLCEGEYSWQQKGSSLYYPGGRQRCKDPDYLEGGFDDWVIHDSPSSSAIRNVTATGFEMQGISIDGSKFWAKYVLMP